MIVLSLKANINPVPLLALARELNKVDKHGHVKIVYPEEWEEGEPIYLLLRPIPLSEKEEKILWGFINEWKKFFTEE